MVPKRSFCTSYKINEAPFETFFNGSWHHTDHLSIKGGTISAHFGLHGSKFEKFCGNNIRFRSRKANSFDCRNFLQPGINICVLLEHQSPESSDEESHSALHDAKIISVAKVSHGSHCICKFLVKFYHRKIVNNVMKTTLEGEVKEINIDHIAIIQELRSMTFENGHRSWCFFRNCFYMHQSRLLNHGFGVELTWLIVLSILRGMSFEVRAIKNRIVYLILNDKDSSVEDDIFYGNFNVYMKVMDFVTSHGNAQPQIEVLDAVLSRPISKTLPDVDSVCATMEDNSENKILCDLYGIRRSKRLKKIPDRFVGDFNKTDRGNQTCKSGICLTYRPVIEVSSQGSPHEESTRSCLEQADSDGSLKMEIQKDFCYSAPLRKTHNKIGCHSTMGMKKVLLSSAECRKRYPSSGDCSAMKKRKVFLSSAECRKVVVSCIENINAETTKKPSIIFDWQTDCFEKLPKETDFNWGASVVAEVKEREYDDIWKEMEYALTTYPFLVEKQEMNEQFCNRDMDHSEERMEQQCEHEFSLDEEFGILCSRCKSIITERKYILPSFGHSWYKSERKTRIENKELMPTYSFESDYLENAISSKNMPLSEQHSVWNLIPDMKLKLYSHQKKAFEVLWQNLAGSLNPKQMRFSKKNGGCVISHSPGTGKTLLVVTFLASYFKVFPGLRPLVLAPKIALDVWIKEFEKWGVSIPVYTLYSLESYKRSFRSSGKQFSRNDRWPSSKIGYVVDCLDKLQKWHKHPSVLLMSYPSFLSLSRCDSEDTYRKFISSVLLKSPGILVLDEGHNPRSTKSKLRKVLMNVKTNLRILLSGTLFQNNFEEYFNSVCLARPNFINDVFKKLNARTAMKYGRKKQKLKKTQNKKEDLARKLFIQEIGTRLESDIEHERKHGLEKLIEITDGFVDVYAGGTLDTLPGQEAYTLILNSTGAQKVVLEKLKVLQKSIRSWETDILVRVASIHPCLIRTISGVTKYFTENELDNVKKYESNYSKGCKIKFVVDLVHKCNINGEKVLIFCRNISPMTMLVDMFAMIFGWHKGKEVLVIHGDQELFDRVKTIDKFNDPRYASNVLLASTMACSEGISLTAASRVILMDPEWNHSKTKQAIARAFRPGQENVVYVYQLLASGTTEEDKYTTRERKDWLSKMLVTGKYIDRSFSSTNYPNIVDNIDDVILKELVEEDQMKAFHMVMKNC